MKKIFLFNCALFYGFMLYAQPKLHTEILIYKTIDSTSLSLVIYSPESAEKIYPAIIFFHGHGSDYQQFEHQAIHLSARGMKSILVEYRDKLGNKNLSRQISYDDAKSAVQYVIEHLKNLRIDPDRIILAGGSKGGGLAIATGFKSIAGIKPFAYVLFNPGVRVDSIPDSPSPMIILHGSNDVTVLPSYIDEFKNKIIAKGGKCHVIYYEGQKHGFFNYSVEGNPYFKKTLMAVDSFLTDLFIIKPIDYSNENWYMGDFKLFNIENFK